MVVPLFDSTAEAPTEHGAASREAAGELAEVSGRLQRLVSGFRF